MVSNEPICDRINTYKNKSSVIPGYEGIPQNLLINCVSWLILLICFCFLRKKAWDYGRLALVKPKRSRWTTLFYSEVGRSDTDVSSVDSVDYNTVNQEYGYCSWIVKFFKLTDADIQAKCGLDAIQYLRFHLYLIVYIAIVTFFCLTIILPVNIHGTLKSPNLQIFGVTTISNVAGDSPTLWVHVLFAFGFFVLAFLAMQHFAKRLRNEASITLHFSEQSLMVSGISRSNCDRELILRHFAELFPNYPIDDIQVCYDIRKLMNLETQYETVRAAYTHSSRYYERKGRRPIIIPRCCGWMCKKCCLTCFYRHAQTPVTSPENSNTSNDRPTNGQVTLRNNNIQHTTDQWLCCTQLSLKCCPPPVDAIDYYSAEMKRLSDAIDIECKRACDTKIGIAFITFDSKFSAASVCRELRNRCLRNIKQKKSSVSDSLRTRAWTVDFAPTPNNIIWANLSTTRTIWWCRAIIVNTCVFTVIFFLTTPTYVFNLLNSLHITDRLQVHNPFLAQFFPSIILWAVSALLPSMVYNSDRLVGHWTKSELHLTVMSKTFALLILMILVLPSLGLTSIPALLQWLFPEMRLIPLIPANPNTTTDNMPTDSENMDGALIPIGPQSFQWECVFMPDNGAFFVNYVITSAFIGTALELVRVSELFVYVCRLMFIRSQAEKAGARKASQFEFDFGLYYAWSLCVFSVITANSILCPLITPFGLIYLILKYLVERYNLYYAYLPSRIDSRVHWLAINFMLASVFILQLNVFMFIALRIELVSRALSISTLLSLICCAILFVMAVVTGWIFIGSSPARRRLLRQSRVGQFTESLEPHSVDWSTAPAHITQAYSRPPTITRVSASTIFVSPEYNKQPEHKFDEYGMKSQPQESTSFKQQPTIIVQQPADTPHMTTVNEAKSEDKKFVPPILINLLHQLPSHYRDSPLRSSVDFNDPLQAPK